MTTHTPLPWKLSYGFDTREFGGSTPPATYVAGPTPEMTGIKLATPWIEGAWDDDAEAAANARYIVHACNLYPELLEALEKAHKWLLVCDDPRCAKDLQFVEGTLRKARGGAS